MNRKKSCFLLVLVLLGVLAIGCSDDTSRITGPDNTTTWDNALSTGTGGEGITFDVQEYYAEGDYYLWDWSQDEPGMEYWVEGHPYDGGTVNQKDITESQR